MAIDTRNKRAACAGVMLPFAAVGPNPGTAEDVAWREQVALSYLNAITVIIYPAISWVGQSNLVINW